ncbi:MAG: TatD family hydrolase [Ardenticatenales bacterium]|nr:TatD family hydrolase [Ardenticatenales bacterium]
MLIDTHCHLDFDRFDEDRDEVVARARAAGVNRIIVPAIDPSNFAKVIGLTEQYDGVYAAIGVHPNATAGWEDGWLAQIRALAAHEKVVAIGEIGLDYYWDRSPKEVQHHAFSAQLALAAELDLPVIVHNRDSSDDVVRLLAESPLAGRERPGVLHSFSAPPATAEAVLALGFYLGFTGPLTFKKADDLRAIAAKVPLDRLLVETDAPFLAPQPYRGKRNEPAYVAEVAERLAAIHLKYTTEMAAITTANAERLFQLP